MYKKTKRDFYFYQFTNIALYYINHRSIF